MMNRNNENLTVTIARQIIAAIAALFLLSLFFSARGAVAEDISTFDMDNWNGETVILEDPQTSWRLRTMTSPSFPRLAKPT